MDRLIALLLLMMYWGMQYGCASPLFEQINDSKTDSGYDAILLAKFSDVSPSPIKPSWIIRTADNRHRFFLTCPKDLPPILFPSQELVINPFYNKEQQDKLFLEGCQYLAYRVTPGNYVLEYLTNRETIFSKEFTVPPGKILYLGNFHPEEEIKVTEKDLLTVKYRFSYKNMKVTDAFIEDSRWFMEKYPALRKLSNGSIVNLAGPNQK